MAALARDPLEEKRREALREQLLEQISVTAVAAFPAADALLGAGGMRKLVELGIGELASTLHRWGKGRGGRVR